MSTTQDFAADEQVQSWDRVPVDSPVPLLDRQKIEGEKMLLAMVRLAKGCHVAVEQFANVISGRVKWTLGIEGRKVMVTGGQVVHLPPNFPHGVNELEYTVIRDMLAPVGAMGIGSKELEGFLIFAISELGQ